MRWNVKGQDNVRFINGVMKMKKSNLVSVVIPTYNRAHKIGLSIDSVFAQSYRPIEIIVVDDGSSDNTDIIIKKWQSIRSCDHDFNIYYIYQDNQGAPVARNRGYQASKGDFIQFLDSDDILCPNKLKIQVELMQTKPDYEWVVGGVRIRGRDSVQESIPQIINSKRDLLDDYIKEVKWFLPHIPLYRRSACEKIGPWNPGLKCLQDWEYGCRAISKLSLPLVCKEVVGEYSYDERVDQITTLGKNSDAYFESKCKAIHLVWSNLEKEGLIDMSVRHAFASRLIHTSRFHWNINNKKALELAQWSLEIPNDILGSIKNRIIYSSLKILGSNLTNNIYGLLYKLKK